MKKVLSINRFTGIETRAAVGDVDHPLVNSKTAPGIGELNTYFQQEGVRLSVNACKQAIKEWGGSVNEITHVVSTTCTNSANPGYDYFVIKELGIKSNVEKVLLHGVGCSGGLAAIRTASNLALGSSFQRKRARILVLACEITTLLVRSELDSVAQNEEVRIGVCLFGDCASACILSNGIGEDGPEEPIYNILGWKHVVIEDTEKDLGFDVDPLGRSCKQKPPIGVIDHALQRTDVIPGWKVVLTPRVPKLAAASVAPAFQDLIKSLPHLRNGEIPTKPQDFDWALHPGGSTIITGVEQAMNLTPEHLRASYEIYMEFGNSSSATIMSVMNRLRKSEDGRENVVAAAFGPGITLEMMILNRKTKLQSLPIEGLD